MNLNKILFGKGAVVLLTYAIALQATGECNTAVIETTPVAAFDTTTLVAQDATEDAIATHAETGLTWMRCSLGLQWDSASQTCIEDDSRPELYTWQEALLDAQGVVYAGYDDWRLPNKKELASIVERQCYEPAINEWVFPDTFAGDYWTSSPVPYASSLYGWFVGFADGSFGNAAIAESKHVRLVRGGK